jgi:tetratricopeptide (TPR) repeat protein
MTYNQNMPYDNEEVRGQVPYLEALYERAIAKYHMDSIKSSFSDFQVCIDNNYEASNCALWQGNLWYKIGKKNKACDGYRKAKELAMEADDIKEADIMIDTYCNK